MNKLIPRALLAIPIFLAAAALSPATAQSGSNQLKHTGQSGPIIDPCRGDGCKPGRHHHHRRHGHWWGGPVVVASDAWADASCFYEKRRRYVPGFGYRRVLVKVCEAL